VFTNRPTGAADRSILSAIQDAPYASIQATEEDSTGETIRLKQRDVRVMIHPAIILASPPRTMRYFPYGLVACAVACFEDDIDSRVAPSSG
jgi:hypothetical protein